MLDLGKKLFRVFEITGAGMLVILCIFYFIAGSEFLGRSGRSSTSSYTSASTPNAKETVLQETAMSSHSVCVLQAGLTISSMRNSGATTVKVVDADPMFIYKVTNTNGVVGFVTCTGNHFKVWVMQ